ncbi:hypothetical protein FFWV33_15830 [Flavobacterium faecale]|uniref:Thoeris protein ThsB TIR-like domain-containing protein n=1 Tax=Flavobacterium faecale TaxID=1355330 RepID=A0A2S1LGQ0_9FLAO|nr:TIR domain-containing protein [Flavobacterium faecale]AWG22889.1 hypothetical protein FFWV33_15830 [Flavobacterium faecale]
MAKNYKIFISHSWSYPDDLIKLRGLLEERGYFNVVFQEAGNDVPINSENASYIKKVLKAKITDSDVVLAIAGMYASYSDWIAWEVETAYLNDIPVIGVIPRGQERISATVTKYSKIDVRWNTESIVEAIRAYAK